jgi:hypothetical protein
MSTSKINELARTISVDGITTADIERTILTKLSQTDPTPVKNDFLGEDRLCGPAIDGNKCVSLLNACINVGGPECKAEWESLDWSSGIENNMDYGAALKMAKTLGLDKKPVEEIVPLFPGGLNDRVIEAFRVIKRRISPTSSAPVARPVAGVVAPGALMRRVAIVPVAGVMLGGGNRNILANYVQLTNALRNNYNMVGGSNSAAVLKASFEDLQALLKTNGKEIETSDVNRIQELIASVARSEQRSKKAAEYIFLLKSALQEAKVSKSDLGAGETITLKLIGELAEKQKTAEAAVSKKGKGLMDIFAAVEELLEIARKSK